MGSSLVLNVSGAQDAVDVFAAGGLGSNRLQTVSDGDNGRILVGDNDNVSDIASLDPDIDSAAIQEISGPTAVNPFLHGDIGLGAATPFIPNLIGGSQIFGFLDGITLQEIDFNPQTTEIDAPQEDALLAVLRLPGGLADIGLGDHPSAINFTGYDWVLVANATGQNLPRPKLSIGVHSNSTSQQADLVSLAFDDIDSATDGPVTLSALNAGQVWVTLIPNDGTSQSVRVNASVAGDNSINSTGDQIGSVINLSGSLLGTNGSDQVDYVTSAPVAANSNGIARAEATFGGFKELVAGTSGELYALAEDRNALVVIDGIDFDVLQVIENNFDGVSGFQAIGDLSVDQFGDFVRVRTGERGIATFARDSATGELSLLQIQKIDADPLDPFSSTTL